MRISSFNKSLLLQSPFPLVFPVWLVDLTHSSSALGSLVCVCGRGCLAEWICVWRWQKTCLVTMGLGDVCSSMCGWWCVRVHMCTGARCKFIFTCMYSWSLKHVWIEWSLPYTCMHLQVSHPLSLYLFDLNNTTVEMLKMCPKPANLLFLYLWLPLALMKHGKKVVSSALAAVACRSADAPALEWDLFCTVESVAQDARRGVTTAGWIWALTTFFVCVCACGFERRRAEENPTVTLQPPQEGCPHCLWWCWYEPHSINQLRGWQGLGCRYVKRRGRVGNVPLYGHVPCATQKFLLTNSFCITISFSCLC